ANLILEGYIGLDKQISTEMNIWIYLKILVLEKLVFCEVGFLEHKFDTEID
ncbi:11317_t:CDS:2, partial [Gigaspora margarita]